MRQVTAYKTDDGKVFDNEVDAAKHECELALQALAGKIFFSGIRPADIADGILDHAYDFHRALARAMEYIPVPDEEDDS